jgi:hypothetical protein
MDKRQAEFQLISRIGLFASLFPLDYHRNASINFKKICGIMLRHGLLCDLYSLCCAKPL